MKCDSLLRAVTMAGATVLGGSMAVNGQTSGSVELGNDGLLTSGLSFVEREPNDLPAQATEINVGRLVLAGEISPTSDVDNLSVFAMAGETIHAETAQGTMDSCQNDIHSLLTILDSNLVVLDSDDSSGEGNCSMVSVTAPLTGKYFIQLQSDFFVTSWTYRLLVSVRP